MSTTATGPCSTSTISSRSPACSASTSGPIPNPIRRPRHGSPSDIDATDPALLFDRYEAAGATVEAARSYYGTVRVNSYIYIVGGNGGTGPLSTIESHAE